MFFQTAAWLSLLNFATAAVVQNLNPPTPALVERQAASSTAVADGACTNSARTRSCWSSGYSINTDFDDKTPPAGKTVTYDLEITNTTMAQPDGSGGDRQVFLVNGQYPGPTIRATWGDTLVINVKNSLQYNGSGIHWHGVRQLNSGQNDGVPGVTECPIAPGKTRTYTFKATQFGTTWYHSHFSTQYGDGVVGPLIIDGPASSNYDVDLGALPITDWYYTPASTLVERAQHSRTGPPSADNILINGTHVNANGGGSYAQMNVVKGKKYRIRLISMAVDNYFSVSMDGHPFTVITSDFVPVKPFVTSQLTMGAGQRYDVIITANQTTDNYWFRVMPGTDCGSNAITAANNVTIGAILHYDGAGSENPTSTADVTMRTSCTDETGLVPFVSNQVPTSVVSAASNVNISSFQDADNDYLFRWLVDGSPMIVNFSEPTLKTILGGSTDFYNNSNVHSIQDSGWHLFYIKSTAAFGLPHPIHLHGHDFYIVGSGTDSWDGTTTGLTLDNPTRRDTATLPPGGYLLIAFPADNPGMWIIHCHIAWHVGEGLAFQFGERYSDILNGTMGDTSGVQSGCNEWDQYWYDGNPLKVYDQTDSGV